MRVQPAAGAADGGGDAAHAGRRFAAGNGEEVLHVHVAGEEAVVEHPQVPFDARLRGALDGAPSGHPALAALDERQVDRGLVGRQIVGVAEAGRGRPGGNRFARRRRPRSARMERGPSSAIDAWAVKPGGFTSTIAVRIDHGVLPGIARASRTGAGGAPALAATGAVPRTRLAAFGQAGGSFREAFVRLLVQAAHHAAQLAHPEVHPDVEKGPYPARRRLGFGAGIHGDTDLGVDARFGDRTGHGAGFGSAGPGAALPAAGGGDEGAEPVQHSERLAVVRHREAAAQSFDDPGHRLRAAVQHPEQVHERGVLAKAVRKRDPPFRGLERAFDGRVEEQLVLGAEVLLGRRVAGGVHAGGQIVAGMEIAADHRIAEEGVDALAGLADDRARLEALAEDAGDVFEQLRFVARPVRGARSVRAPCTALAASTACTAPATRVAPGARMARAAEGGRRPDADQLPRRHPEPDPQAPDEAARSVPWAPSKVCSSSTTR